MFRHPIPAPWLVPEPKTGDRQGINPLTVRHGRAIQRSNLFRQTYVVQTLASDRQKWIFGIALVASAYSAAIGEELYPYSLLLFLFVVLVAASMFGRIATAATLVISCLAVAYFVVPPVFSFRMEGWELLLFVAYVSAAVIGSVTIQSRTLASARREELTVVDAGSSLILVFDSERGLRSTSTAFLAFTGKRSDQLEGFLWLRCVGAGDRDRLVRLIRRGRGKMLCDFIDASGAAEPLHVSVESRFQLPRLFRKTVTLTVTEIVN